MTLITTPHGKIALPGSQADPFWVNCARDMSEPRAWPLSQGVHFSGQTSWYHWSGAQLNHHFAMAGSRLLLASDGRKENEADLLRGERQLDISIAVQCNGLPWTTALICKASCDCVSPASLHLYVLSTCAQYDCRSRSHHSPDYRAISKR